MNLLPHAHKIWLFSLVKKKGSVSAAALAAKVSPSAVSQALTQLETIVGAKLIERAQRGVRIRPEGHAFLESCQPALAALEAFDLSALAKSAAPTRLRMGAYESIAIDLLPRFVPALRAKWPLMDIEIEIARSRTLLDRCARGELDVVFVADATHSASILVESYAVDTYGVFASRAHHPVGSLAQIADTIGFGALTLDDKHHTRSLKRFLRSLTPSLRPTLETESFEVILALVRGGAIAGALPLRVAARAGDELRRLDSLEIASEGQPDLSGRHDLSLACRDTFSRPMFVRILGLARSESGGLKT